MGGVQTQRHSKGKRNARRSHHALTGTALAVCSKCQKAILPHHICKYCGTYNGKMEVDVLAKLDKKDLKKRQKLEAAEHERHGKRETGEPTPELNPAELSKK